MNKIKKISMILMLIIIISTQCSAITITEGSSIDIRKTIEVPYHYENEEKTNYFIILYNTEQIYSLGKYNILSNTRVSKGQEYNNIEIRNILENGYPIQMYSTLGCANWEEAYIATQEAIYCKLENKNVNKYIAENESGQRIINAMKKILKPKAEILQLTELSDWINLSKTEKYKEYSIHCSHELVSCTAETMENNVKITDVNGNVKQTIRNGERFRIVVPKNQDMTVNIKLRSEIVGIYVHKCSSVKNENIQYVMPEIRTIQENKDFKIDVNTAKVNILNQDEDNNIISGSSFDILDSDQNKVMESLNTNSLGKISINLDKGIYYLKQTNVNGNYELNKAIIEIDLQNVKNASITVTNTRLKKEEISTLEKEINIKEETKQIKENNIKEVTNINTQNINREIINETNVTNLNNVNKFINTINRKNVVNLEKENIYRNTIEEMSKQNKILDGENINLNMTRSDYINHIDMLMHSKINVPILPVASR